MSNYSIIWNYTIVCLIVLVAFFTNSHAIVLLDTVSVVTDLENFDHAQATVIITPETWEGRTTSLADVLENNAGIQTRRFGGLGAFQTVSIRGQNGSRVVVCIDGIPLNSAAGGAVDLGKIDMSRIERVEVYKSFVPARFGVTSVAGLINLVTQKGSGSKRQFHGGITYGSFNTHLLSLSLYEPLNKAVQSFSAVSYKHSDNNFEYLDRNKTSVDVSDDTVRQRLNDDYNAVDLFQKLSVHRETQTFEATIEGHANKKGLPGGEDVPGGEDGNATLSKETTVQAGAHLAYRRHFMNTLYPELSIGVAIKYKYIGLSLYHEDFPLFVKRFTETSTENTYYSPYGSLSLFLFDKVRLYGNSRVAYEMLLPKNVTGDKINGSFKNSRISLINSAEMNIFATEYLELTTRYLNTIIDNYSSNDTVSVKRQFNNTYNTGARLTSNRTGAIKFTAYGNVGFNSKIPTLDEKFGTQNGVMPNEELIPEEAFEYEVGGRIVIHKTYLEAVYFSKEITNWIVPKYSLGIKKFVNEKKVITNGIEIIASADVFNCLKNRSNLTLQGSENLTNSSAHSGKLLPYIPFVTVHNHIEYYTTTWSLYYDVSYISRMYRDLSNDWESTPQFTHDLFGTYHIGSKWKIVVGVEDILSDNIADESVYDSYPSPGRRFSIHISINQ